MKRRNMMAVRSLQQTKCSMRRRKLQRKSQEAQESKTRILQGSITRKYIEMKEKQVIL